MLYTAIESIHILVSMREVRFGDGIARATSVINSEPRYQAAEAFKEGANEFWHSGRDAKGYGNVEYSFPHMIWYEFPENDAFVPARVSFKARTGSGCNAGKCGATKYQFIGSNDAGCDRFSKWTILCEDLSGKLFQLNEVKYCQVKRGSRKRFRCLGISVLASSWSSHNEVSMGGIRMWAYE